MNEKHIVGFDFGTTNCLVSKIQGGRAINFSDKKGMPFPSVVCYEGAKKIYGREAKALLGGAGLGVQSNIVYSPKRELDQEYVHVAGVKRSTVKVVSDVVGFVARETYASPRAKSIELEKIDRAVVTIPVNMNGKRRARLRDAFLRAGISIEQFVHEPLAAIYGFFRQQDGMNAMLRRYNRKLILVFDWGGGTLDLTLCQLKGGKLDQLANDGTAGVGGDFFDDLLQKEIVRRVERERGIENPEYREHAKARLRYRCEQAKIALSSRDKSHVHVPGFFRGLSDEDLDYSLSREDLEVITKSLLVKGFKRINALLKNAGVSRTHVDLCLPTGGMTNMPKIKELLHERFGSQCVQDHARKETLVAEGAAWIAHDGAKLHLAKDIELLLARNSYMALLGVGWVLPTEGEIQKNQSFDLYCTDPCDGHAKFRLCVPIDLGDVKRNAPRRPLKNLIVEVDSEADPFFERLRLTVSVDHNLILQVDAWSSVKNDFDEGKIYDIEFGLSFPGEVPVEGESSDLPPPATSTSEHEDGAVVFRSNVFPDHKSRKHLMSHVPGELLVSCIERFKKWDKGDVPDYRRWLDRGDVDHFDKRNDVPTTQRLERRYRRHYEPCTKCGRPLNHPLCRCASSLKRA